jgi:mono/diheme cytochrome c family protein
LSALAFCTLAALPLWTISSRGGGADESVTNSLLGQADAIEAGKQIYSSCYICHHGSDARGLDLFATKLSDKRFLETVINGRKGKQTPAFGLRLLPEEVWHVHAYVKSTDHY